MMRLVVVVTYGPKGKGGKAAFGPFFSVSAAKRYIATLGQGEDGQIFPLNDPEVPTRTSCAVAEMVEAQEPVNMVPSVAEAVDALVETLRRVRIGIQSSRQECP